MGEKWRRQFLGLAAAAAFSSCATASAPEVHAFPSAWPAGLDRPVSSAAAAAPAPAPAGMKTIRLEPFALDLDGPSGSSAEALTDLFAQQLRAAGVQAGPGDSRYLFRGAVPQLGYAVRGGYPHHITYFSRLVYQLVDRPTGRVVWTGNVQQEFEETVLVNTMTRLPSEPDRREKILLEKCIQPTWNSVAQDVAGLLEKREGNPS